MRIAIRSGLSVGLSLLAGSTLAAQNPECGVFLGSPANVCNAAIDGIRTFHPMAGLLTSGGNAEIGAVRTLGGLGRFSITTRVNAVKVQLPDLSYDGSTPTVAAGDELFVPSPIIEAAVGIWPGLAGGLLSVDVLGSAQLLPVEVVDGLGVDPSARSVGGLALGLGYGLRVGILNGDLPIPGIAVSVMRRDIPEVRYGDIAEGDTYSFAANLKATNVRAIAGWELSRVVLGVGLGLDRYTGAAGIVFDDPSLPVPRQEISVELSNTRYLGFVNAGLDFSIVRLGAELGYQLGKDQNVTTDFENIDTAGGKVFAGFGIRLGL
ncbi:MAG TPA: hypothetical protein VK845_03965 [Gemmatimonadales bacterium]|nr:hypothetical protein [Gemmatimonadales bacterium]